jgi:membrane dipeptidase
VALHPGDFLFATTAEDIRRARREHKIAALIGIEGGHAIEDSLRLLRLYYDLGVRYMTLTHSNSNHWADSSGDANKPNNGLSAFGKEVVAEMNRLGMIVDLAHVGRAAFLDSCSRSERPVIVSHSGISGAFPLWRNIDDEQLRAVARLDGVVGIIFAWRYLGARRRGIEMLAPHFQHVRKLVGARHLALGSDFDGAIEPVRGLENVSKLPAVTSLLEDMNWSEDEIRGVLGENVLRVLDRHTVLGGTST